MQIRSTAIASALLWSSLAASATAAPLQPVDKWQLDFGDTRCVAARAYGDAASPVIFAIIPSLNGNYYKVMVSVPQAGPPLAKETRGTVDFGRGPINSELLYFGKAGVNQSVYQFTLSAADIAQAETATAVLVKSDRASYDFSLSEMPNLFGGLRKCNTDLQQYWNMGGAVTAGKPVADIKTVLTAKDYPTEAQRMKPKTTLQYQLLIDESGAVAGCDAVAPSGAQVLDATGCQVIVAQVKFRPAKDSNGKPMRSAWMTPPLTWNSVVESSFDSACSKMAADGRTIVDMCGQMPRENPSSNISRDPVMGAPPPPSPK